MPARDPDASVVALFRHHAIKNDAKTAAEGRPIYDDMEVCEIRFSGSRAVSVFPATAFSHWVNNPQTGEQTPQSYAERFQRQYIQFKSETQQTKAGTPLDYVPFVTVARRAELKALNIYTVEALATLDGQELKNLGHNGRDLKNKAEEYLAEAKNRAPDTATQAELEALRARNAVLEEDAKMLIARGLAETPSDKADTQFDDMTTDQIRDYITTNSGHAPHGTINRKTLVRMASDLKQKA